MWQDKACSAEDVSPEGPPAVVAESGPAALSSEAEGEAAEPVDAPPEFPAVPPDPVVPPTNGAPAYSMHANSLT